MGWWGPTTPESLGAQLARRIKANRSRTYVYSRMHPNRSRHVGPARSIDNTSPLVFICVISLACGERVLHAIMSRRATCRSPGSRYPHGGTEVLHRDIILSTYVLELRCCTDQPSSILNVRRAAAAFPPPLNFNVVVAFEHLGSDFFEK